MAGKLTPSPGGQPTYHRRTSKAQGTEFNDFQANSLFATKVQREERIT